MNDITVTVTCPKCEQQGILYEYTDPSALAGNKFSGYVYHASRRQCCMLRAREVEKLVKRDRQ